MATGGVDWQPWVPCTLWGTVLVVGVVTDAAVLDASWSSAMWPEGRLCVFAPAVIAAVAVRLSFVLSGAPWP